jgi:hypothetical protein
VLILHQIRRQKNRNIGKNRKENQKNGSVKRAGRIHFKNKTKPPPDQGIFR